MPLSVRLQGPRAALFVMGGTLLTGGAGTILGALVGVLPRTLIQNVINQIGTTPTTRPW